jgi:flavin-dependent dehydrogenase
MSHSTADHARIPIVIGAGLTGLSISYSLSRAGVDHVLIGRRPDASPRLGESMNLEGTLLLWEMYPQLSRFFFPKKQVLGYCGDYEVVCDFDVAQRAVSRAVFRALGYAPVDQFLQLDRIGFDAALWDLVVASEHCTVHDAQVTQLDFDAAADAFSRVLLADGTALRPSYVFDATNHGRMLGQTAKLAYRTLGDPQRVVHTHFHLAPNASGDAEAWELTTAVVRLFREADGIDAIAWCIPLGDYVSVGSSMSATESELPNAALLDRVATAFARYGVDYRRRFSAAAEVKGLRHSYFVYERAFGANWLLAGPSFCQVWWMASAGVGTALAAAQLAPKLLDEPARWGAEYNRYMHRLISMQETFDYFALAPREAYEPENLHRFSDRFVITNLTRLAASARMRDSRLAMVAAPALGWAFSRDGAIRDYCAVQRVHVRMRAA